MHVFCLTQTKFRDWHAFSMDCLPCASWCSCAVPASLKHSCIERNSGCLPVNRRFSTPDHVPKSMGTCTLENREREPGRSSTSSSGGPGSTSPTKGRRRSVSVTFGASCLRWVPKCVLSLMLFLFVAKKHEELDREHLHSQGNGWGFWIGLLHYVSSWRQFVVPAELETSCPFYLRGLFRPVEVFSNCLGPLQCAVLKFGCEISVGSRLFCICDLVDGCMHGWVHAWMCRWLVGREACYLSLSVWYPRLSKSDFQATLWPKYKF